MHYSHHSRYLCFLALKKGVIHRRYVTEIEQNERDQLSVAGFHRNFVLFVLYHRLFRQRTGSNLIELGLLTTFNLACRC